MSAAVAPLNRYTSTRFHWVKGNDFEVWEWLRNGSWLRPGNVVPISDTVAAKQGWSYVEPALRPTGETP